MSSQNSEDRSKEINQRQRWIAQQLEAVKADQLLLLEPENIHWFCGMPLTKGILYPSEMPCLILSPELRWLVCSNSDAQRLFDSYLDDLGFQLKVWPWHGNRDKFLADLCVNKRLASDRLINGAVCVGNILGAERLQLSEMARKSLRTLGRDLAHALDATCRNIQPGESEHEVAGQLGHRLLHHGIDPIAIHVAADDRLTSDHRPGSTEQTITCQASVFATAGRDGVHASAGRTLWLEPPNESTRAAFDTVGQVTAARLAVMSPNTTASTVWTAGQGVAAALGREHDWHECPFGWLTGWQPVEKLFVPTSIDPMAPGMAVVWQCRHNGCLALDTYLMEPNGPIWLTRDPEGPIRHFKLGTKLIELAGVHQR